MFLKKYLFFPQLIGNDWKPKIGDFGFSRVKAEHQTMTQLGTVSWTSPEIFEGRQYTVCLLLNFYLFVLLSLTYHQEKADIFGFAVLLWELIFARKPWQGIHTMKVITMVLCGQRLSLKDPPLGAPPVVSPRFLIYLFLLFYIFFFDFFKLLELITSCWQQNPVDRPSAQDIVTRLSSA
jgi:serine/threonine protein kinase